MQTKKLHHGFDTRSKRNQMTDRELYRNGIVSCVVIRERWFTSEANKPILEIMIWKLDLHLTTSYKWKGIALHKRQWICQAINFHCRFVRLNEVNEEPT